LNTTHATRSVYLEGVDDLKISSDKQHQRHILHRLIFIHSSRLAIRMEEYDDLSQGPSNDGTLDLSHNTWKSLPPELNDFTQTLLHLDLKNNQLTNIDSIGNLILLRSLDVSFNQLSTIPASIGKTLRLRTVNVAQNQLISFPEEIGNCILLVSSIVYYCMLFTQQSDSDIYIIHNCILSLLTTLKTKRRRSLQMTINCSLYPFQL